MLGKMLVIATTKHANQFDKAGMPYILHPLKVMHYLKTDDEELQCIALGHDLLEDCFESVGLGVAFLIDQGISDRIIQGILALTKREGETYVEYKAKVKSNPDSVKVKMADLRHNSDIRRLKGITAKDIERTTRYFEFYEELRECL